MGTVKVEIKLLPVCRDDNGNIIVPPELINIKNKGKYIKEKIEELIQLNKSTINEGAIEVQIRNIHNCLDNLINAICSLKDVYKEYLSEGYSKEKLQEKYGCTQEEWEKNFTYDNEFNIEDSLGNYLRYLENNIKVTDSKEDYGECKDRLDGTKSNITVTTDILNGCLCLLANIENVIKDLQQTEIDESKKENLFIEPSKNSMAYYRDRLAALLKSSSSELAENIKKVIDGIKNCSSAIRDDFGDFFIRKAISFGSVGKTEKIFSMRKEEWDSFIENIERIDYSEVINKLLNILGNILEHTKKENMGEEAINAVEEDISNINGGKDFSYVWQNLVNQIEDIGEIKMDRYISPEVRREVWRRDRGRCVQCGSRLNLEFDHIIPVSKGGSNTSRNIQLLCENCNREKYNNI